jgi:signal transduction histidine kinase
MMSSVSLPQIKAPEEEDPLDKLLDRLAAAKEDLAQLQAELEKARVHGLAMDILEHVAGELVSVEQSIGDLSLLQQVEAGRLTLDMRPLDLLAAVQKIVAEIAHVCRRQLKPLCLEASTHVIVVADSKLLSRMLEILLACALAHGRSNTSLIVDIEDSELSATVHVIAQGCRDPRQGETAPCCPCPRHSELCDERLALCSRVAEAHGGRLTTTRAVGGLGVDYALMLNKPR